jgi:hypothetical protein
MVLAGGVTTAWAGDDVQVTVAAIGTPAPALNVNGNEATQGTIQLFYTVTAFAFPLGDFGQFSVSMGDVHLTGANNAAYPATLTLQQNGSDNLSLTTSQSSFSISGLGWTGSTIVQIAIPSGVSDDDGAELVGNLNLSVPGPNHVGTPSTIQVHIKLVHPTACVKPYDFITDADFNAILTSAGVTVKNNSVKSSQPGQFGDDVLVANTCATSESFDLGITLDPRFETNPNGNPGNAVFLYSTAGEMDPSTFNIAAFGAGSAQGQSLCLQNVTMSPDSSLLATVHSQVVKGQNASALGTSPFAFTVSLRAPNSGCAGPLNPDALPNPASVSLPFTVN